MIQKKICLLGASSVGKTSLIRQFVDGIFSDRYLTTIGVKVDKKLVEVEGEKVQFILWDIEGNDRYNLFQERYLRGAAAYIIVVDQTRMSSFLDGMSIQALAKKAVDCPSVLAINKSDLTSNLQLSEDDLESHKSQFDFCFNTSAKTGDNVEKMFSDLARQFVGDK